METIKQLRQMLQAEKVEGRERPWGYGLFQRGPSIYITRLLLTLPITPNQVTFAGILIGLLGCYLVYLPNFWLNLTGIFLLYCNILSDKIDGEMARYKKIFSLRGIYLDNINHLVIPPLFFLAAAFGIGSTTTINPILIIFFGTTAALAMSLIRTGWSIAPQIFAKKYLKRPELFSLPQPTIETAIEKIKKRHTVLKTMLGVVHQFQEFFMILMVFFVGLIVERMFFPDHFFHPLTSWLIVAFGILLPLIFIENCIKGFFDVEQKIADLKSRFIDLK